MQEQEKQGYIHIKGARVHNLKNIDLDIPHNQLIVITGLSGSGKSTLAFDTIFAEGQRRYVESLSAYARQFLGRMDKPDVDLISGIAPAIAIEQKVNTRNPRSTVGTTTEIYDYLKLLFARVGHTYSPISGREVKCYQVQDIVSYIVSQSGKKVLICAGVHTDKGQGAVEKLTLLVKDGIQRIYRNGNIITIEDLLASGEANGDTSFDIVVDRVRARDNEELKSRLGDSVAQAIGYGNGSCKIIVQDDAGDIANTFSTRFEADGMTFEVPTEHMFSFNNPIGACPVCEGYGKVTGIDEDLVVPDKTKSIYDDAIAAWRGETMKWWKEQLIASANRFDFPIHRPYYELTEAQKRLLWTGNRYFKGLNDFFAYLESERYKIQYRVLLSRYTGKTICHECGGSRLRKEALYVKVGGRNIAELVKMSVDDLTAFFDALELDEHDSKASARVLVEIRNRLSYLSDVGLGYLTLDRLSSTLSGGESQRINLATSLGSNLTGSLYILDEPSIGLHPRDTARLIKVLKQLRDLGNTVIVVEHEEEIMRAADRIIDIGPEAGYNGGNVVFNGTPKELEKASGSLTADYLTGRKNIQTPKHVRGWSNYIEIKGARENNLKGIDVRIPLGVMTCITGVSGSGKSSLVKGILYPAVKRRLFETGLKPGNFESLSGDVDLLRSIEMIDQNPIGKSLRSNPVTYTKAYDYIRKIFAEQPYAVNNGMTPSYFSFNRPGGRCEECQGDGYVTVGMQFMADIVLTCEHCGGKRFNEDVLEVKYRDRSIYDVLEMTVDEAMEFFACDDTANNRKVLEILKTLQDVGLGYIKLGQSTSTLSGGEIQRVKLASFLMKDNNTGSTLFVFDEPTTGLHFHDINKLLAAFNALIERGNTIVVVEHNMDVIKCADWVIDLGPEAGDAGGHLVFEGQPSSLVKCSDSYTGKYLAFAHRKQQ